MMHELDRLARDIVLVTLLVGCSCSGTPTAPARDDHGPPSGSGVHVRGLREGPWTDDYPDGHKQCEGRYENDLQAGLWTYWFENGNKEMEGRFVNQRRDGDWKSWYENGMLRAEGRFEAGFEEGPWRFHASSGVLEHEGSFELGLPVLRWTYFHPNGAVRETGNYLAGVKVGPWITRDAAGNETGTSYAFPAGCELVEEHSIDSTLRRTGFLRDGAPAGRWHSFHPGGRLRLECSFSNGAPNGSAHAWREDGSLLGSGRLKNGCVIGKWRLSRGAVWEELESRDARPRRTFGGDWSPARSADLPGWEAVETWVAEIGSPRQPAPIQPVVAPQPSAPAPARGTDDVSGIPARAQPWTEYEIAALPGLVRFYLTGEARISSAHDWKVQVMRSHPSAPAAAVSAPEDLIGRTLPSKRFATADGGEIDLDDSRGKRNVLVTILRGFGGHVCVYCTAQTKALAELADKFAALDTQVVVVFPGPASGLEAFLEAYRRTFGPGEKPPFPLLYDRDLTLTRALHIEGNIAVPTSILLDREGIIRWCRVAKDPADRPSAQEILERIAALPEHEH